MFCQRYDFSLSLPWMRTLLPFISAEHAWSSCHPWLLFKPCTFMLSSELSGVASHLERNRVLVWRVFLICKWAGSALWRPLVGGISFSKASAKANMFIMVSKLTWKQTNTRFFYAVCDTCVGFVHRFHPHFSPQAPVFTVLFSVFTYRWACKLNQIFK